jgi:hypothetical protein
MLNKMFIKKVSVALFSCVFSLFCAQSQSGIIADFDAEAKIEVSSTFKSSKFTTELCCNNVSVYGSASGDASGSSDAGPFTLAAGETGTLNAAAKGEVTGLQSYVDSIWSTYGYLLIDNEFGANSIKGDVNFDMSWSAGIFTNSLYSQAFAGVAIGIEDSYGKIIFDDYIEFDSFFDGPGTFGATQVFTFSVIDLTIGQGDYEEYYISMDTYGFAEVQEPDGFAKVPEPDGIFLAGLVLLFAFSKRKMSS